MRSALVVVLVIANGLLWWSARGSAREREALEERLTELTTAASRSHDLRLLREETAALVDAFTESLDASGPFGPLDVATLRDELIGMENGLALDRLSLDFRPFDSARSGTEGTSIRAAMRGRFPSIYTYLARVDASSLPLAAEELRLRRDADGLVSLDARWSAVWGVAGEHELAPTELARLESWLSRRSVPAPGRNLFQSAVHDLRAKSPQAVESRVEPTPTPAVVLVDAELPELTGFVLARPELEPDLGRRVLAAVRFKGELRLLQVGDDIDGYALEQVEPLESVTLFHVGTGERLVLRLP